jgi:hypothetical protein
MSNAEYERAKERGMDFILALVSGLEVGQKDEVRLIIDPANRLSFLPINGVRLGGLLEAPCISRTRTGQSPGSRQQARNPYWARPAAAGPTGSTTASGRLRPSRRIRPAVRSRRIVFIIRHLREGPLTIRFAELHGRRTANPWFCGIYHLRAVESGRDGSDLDGRRFHAAVYMLALLVSSKMAASNSAWRLSPQPQSLPKRLPLVG